MINLPNRCQRLISRAEWHTVRLKGASGESEGLRRYDKENLLWQSTVAIRSDPVGSLRIWVCAGAYSLSSFCGDQVETESGVEYQLVVRRHRNGRPVGCKFEVGNGKVEIGE